MIKTKKIIAAIAAAVIAAASCTAVFAQTYSDVPASHWAYNSVERCTASNWFSGYPDGTFHPEDSITRAEAVKTFVVFNSIPVSQPSSTKYTDLSLTSWYAPYVEAGSYLFPERTTPAGEKIFQGDFPVTREDTIYALVKVLRYDNEVQFADLSVLNMFKDQNSISQSIKPYVAVAVKYGLASGYEDGTIGAQDPLTRAQFAALLYRGTMLGTRENVSSNIVISSVTADPMTLKSVKVGESFDVTANVVYTDSSSKTMTDEISLISSDTSVVTTNRNKVTAVAPGTAIITSNTAGMENYNLVVTVEAPDDAPVITLDSYEASTEEETAVITGKVTDTTGTAVTLTVNGKEVGVTSDGSFTATVDLSLGTNTISLSAKNTYGNEGVQTATIEREAAPTPAPTAEPTPEPTPDTVTVQ